MASVCQSLQCLISALTQAVEVVSHSGSLVQSCCGEGGPCRQIPLCVGKRSPGSSHTGFALAHGCVFSPSTLLRLPDALYGAGPELHAVPVFGSSTKARTRLRLRFVPSPAEQLRQAAGSLTGSLSPGAAHLLPSKAPASVSPCASRVRAPCV